MPGEADDAQNWRIWR